MENVFDELHPGSESLEKGYSVSATTPALEGNFDVNLNIKVGDLAKTFGKNEVHFKCTKLKDLPMVADDISQKLGEKSIIKKNPTYLPKFFLQCYRKQTFF